MKELLCNKCDQLKPEDNFLRSGRYIYYTCRPCRNIIRRKWRAENPEQYHAEHRTYQQKWRAENKSTARAIVQRSYKKHNAKIRAKRIERYLENPAVEIAKTKKWQAANPEKHLANARAWYKKNTARSLNNHKLWNAKNPEQLRLLKKYSNARRKARKLANGFEKFSFAEILLRDGNNCHICGGKVARKELSFDHLIPLSKGGSHTRKNVAVAHLKCNVKRGAGKIPAQLLLVG